MHVHWALAADPLPGTAGHATAVNAWHVMHTWNSAALLAAAAAAVAALVDKQ